MQYLWPGFQLGQRVHAQSLTSPKRSARRKSVREKPDTPGEATRSGTEQKHALQIVLHWITNGSPAHETMPPPVLSGEGRGSLDARTTAPPSKFLGGGSREEDGRLFGGFGGFSSRGGRGAGGGGVVARLPCGLLSDTTGSRLPSRFILESMAERKCKRSELSRLVAHPKNLCLIPEKDLEYAEFGEGRPEKKK
uniref:Uncharacterized protein n=1 Tax=Setaria digitata TaxID=48799 RepID=A0A915PJV6_9BILA